MPFKLPWSVLVVIHTVKLEVLLLQRANAQGTPSGFWQSVTGSKDHADEAWADTAAREVWEETGLDCRACGPLSHCLSDWQLENTYDIYPEWRHRYAPDVVINTERVFGLMLPEQASVVLSPREHTEARWLPWLDAADGCTSASNAEAVLQLPARWGRAALSTT